MKGFLGLASDFIERMSNPAFGTQVNESYGLRLAQLLAHDKEMASAMTGMNDLQDWDVSLLTTDGWLWLLGWMKSHGTRPPDAFLHSLFDSTNYLPVRLRVVEAVTATAGLERFRDRHRESPPDIREFPESWLRTRMVRAVGPQELERRRERDGEPRFLGPENVDLAVAESVELATLLLQVGNETALLTARSLLAHRWKGSERLRTHITQLFSGLDEETRSKWYFELGLKEGWQR